MKKILALLLVLAMTLSLVACGGKTEEKAPEAAAPEAAAPAETASEYKVAMVTDYGDITDQSFNQTTWEAVIKFGEDNGIAYKYYKPTSNDTAGRVASVELAIAEGYNVIVMPGYAFGTTVAEVSGNYPDIKFVALDVAKGDLSKVTAWLKEKIHRHASFLKPGELFKSVCGKFDARYYTNYLTEKYTKLYNL